ncbi:MAG TPA: hypothetical protein VEQ58_18500 [Polyangiaceae bacterium]|nr:hypothetical protein [Polyangiaceae bacterium]
MELPPPNYDEALVPAYRLPELLRTESGASVDTAATWQEHRRPELLELFRRHVYGRFEADVEVRVTTVLEATTCGGWAKRRELDVELIGQRAALTVRVLIYGPAQQTGPFPAFLGLNLYGNQTVHPDPAIRLAEGWLPEKDELGLLGNVATEASRGMHAARFPIELLLSRGYALVTAYVGDIDPDFDDQFQNGAHALLTPAERTASDAPGTIAAWSWGLSRILDALAEQPSIDRERIAVFGHSRLGKAALWAGAQDPRFALAISNESGCGGAALSRRDFGERLLHLNQRFPHWFCPAFHAFNQREAELPVDQHQLLALLAPRPVYVASAAADRWADPHGEWLACQAASPAYELFGLSGATHIGYHCRPGRHDITPRDFWHYLEFADRHFGAQRR